MTVTFSPAANHDLMDIASYIAQDNPGRALSFVDELEDSCHRLDVSPGIGTARPELGDGIRLWPHGNYLIFYRAGSLGIRIERIMHGARDVGANDLDATEIEP
jgi:toxin ParE1/3/4